MHPLKYIQSNLLTNEKIIYGVRPHWIIFGSTVFFAILSLFFWIKKPILLTTYIIGGWNLDTLASGILLIVAIYCGIGAFIQYMNSEYGITNKRVLIKVGWISRDSLEIMLEKVEGVLVDQTILGRILSYGTITIIGTGGTKDSFPYIPAPLEFRRTVQEAFDMMENKHKGD
ncbi:MAG: hypothetical protein ACD_29C00077G0002 [uncultured bacterium]|nr:MAG: hypothetical protein ACD_29C00077G0002 [uncultured bacterium]